MYEGDVSGDSYGDNDQYEEPKHRPAVTAEDSLENLKAGIEHVKQIIEGTTGKFIGAQLRQVYPGTSRYEIVTIAESSHDNVLGRIASGKDWSPLYDDSLAISGYGSRSVDRFTYHIGSKEVYSVDYMGGIDAEPTYRIAGKPVTSDDLTEFTRTVKELLKLKYVERGDAQPEDRTLPEDERRRVEQIRFDRRTREVLQKGERVEPGNIKFVHGPYGSSHFGSGGGWGHVHAYELSAWEQGQRVEKAVELRFDDDGFTRGPVGATIPRDTIIIARGGDMIGDHGRFFEEIFICR